MKKLMIAAVALTGLSAFALTSQNVVGYQTIENRQGNTLQVATFNAVSGEGYDLQDIKPVGATVVGGGETSLQTLNANKTTAKVFYWLTEDEWDTDNDEDGWFLDPNVTDELAEYDFAPGEGYIFSSANGAATLSFPEL